MNSTLQDLRKSALARHADADNTVVRQGGVIPPARFCVSPDLIEIYTDGACKGNPGPGGWGALLRYHNTQHTLEKRVQEQELFGSEAITTNNRMELMAVIKALEALQHAGKIVIYTDSQYVQKGISEWIHNWKRKNWLTASKTPVKNVDLWKQLDALVTERDIQWRWIKGHAGHPQNERADTLANQGIAALQKGT